MKQKLTETEHIRSILETIREEPNYSNMPGPGDASPPDDPDVEFSDQFIEVAEKAGELKNQFEKFLSAVDKNPKAVYQKYKGMDLEGETGHFADAFPRFLENKWAEMVDESDDFVDSQPKTKSELKTHIQFWADWFKRLDDLIEKYDQEINDHVTPEQGDDFVEPVDPKPPKYYDGGPY